MIKGKEEIVSIQNKKSSEIDVNINTKIEGIRFESWFNLIQIHDEDLEPIGNMGVKQSHESKESSNLIDRYFSFCLFSRVESSYSCNENSYLHVRFQLNLDFESPDYIAVYLMEPEGDRKLYTAVPASYTLASKSYVAVLDFGDPDLVLPVNGENGDYLVTNLVILVGDQRLVNPITKTVTQVNVQFTKQAVKKREISLDTYVERKEDITPSDVPVKKPNIYVNQIF